MPDPIALQWSHSKSKVWTYLNCVNILYKIYFLTILRKLITLTFSFRYALSRLHLRMTRGTEQQLKQLIIRSLETILNQCMELKLLPSIIMKQLGLSKYRMPSQNSKTAAARHQCNRFSKVIAYAQLILCWSAWIKLESPK